MIIIDLRPYSDVTKSDVTKKRFDLVNELLKLIDQIKGATKIIYDQPDYIVLYKDQYKYLKHRVKLPSKTKYAIAKHE
jgi:hypothetical protein